MLRGLSVTAGFIATVTPSPTAASPGEPDPTDSAKAWLRLAVAVALSTIGGAGMWSVVVALPAIQADFGVARADAALPFTLVMVGFAGGGVMMGRLADRFGIAAPLALGTVALTLGYLAVGLSSSLWQVALAHGLLIGVGCSATFGPLMAEMSHWFVRRRGIAVAIAASGNYLAGTIWPPVVQHFISTDGWRATHTGIGIFMFITMLPLVFLMRHRVETRHTAAASAAFARQQAAMPFSPMTLQVLLCIAGVACCVAMAMPQVHLVAYCGDLGYGAARGAEMLSLMLFCGIFSRIASGFIADRIGGVRTLLLGAVLQGSALSLYLVFDGLASLYVISALFGLFQGGIVPSYAIIVREYFSPKEAGTRLGLVLMATLLGMALGGWMSGAIFDATGSYQAAFLNGIAWNLVNVAIMVWLMLRSRRRPMLAAAV
jgi:MFS family permease